eukprot:CAMPEP_0197251988 /NCGR_PEP_ID=MMETSP1429-20130617/59369_1 /TAXON_ID=49237 /ORGANISM="Chaetoceros  sp., Strain UNC1202" /LENGTH=41 /DNA_ID= /DNA_START= /DNA_END= /DNA_ORIENTATION=
MRGILTTGDDVTMGGASLFAALRGTRKYRITLVTTNPINAA